MMKFHYIPLWIPINPIVIVTMVLDFDMDLWPFFGAPMAMGAIVRRVRGLPCLETQIFRLGHMVPVNTRVHPLAMFDKAVTVTHLCHICYKFLWIPMNSIQFHSIPSNAIKLH